MKTSSVPLWTIVILLVGSVTAVHQHGRENLHRHRRQSNVLPRSVPTGLKISCIGDSITVGVGDDTTDPDNAVPDGKHNGYRLGLYNLLTHDGLNPTFIGGVTSGSNNPQPNCDGYGGHTINMILSDIQADNILAQHPDLILIHAGTNDIGYGNDGSDPATNWANAPGRLGALLDYVLCQAPDAVVLVAMIVQNHVFPDHSQQLTDAFNQQVPSVVGERYEKGYKIRVVDMSVVNELIGDLHPTAAGYTVMANIWHQAIQAVPDSWWSTGSNSGTSAASGGISTCDRNSISFSSANSGNELTSGYHVDGDSPEPNRGSQATDPSGNVFNPGWGSANNVALGIGRAGSGVQFTDLNGDGKTDYVWVNYTAGSEGSFSVVLSGGGLDWNPVNEGGAVGWGLPGTSHVEFADLDGDKLPEYILIQNGQFAIFKNGGQTGKAWQWTQMPNANNELNYLWGGNAPYHWFADVTGDGRADLMVLDGTSVLDLYINQGPNGNGGFTWKQCKSIGYFVDTPMFVDIDGDGRADYIAKDTSGGTRAWINSYTGDCNLKWVPVNGGSPKSLTYSGDPSEQIHFADLSGDGKADYLSVGPTNGDVTMRANLGSTGPPPERSLGGYGASVRLNDMDGDGFDDYVYVTNLTGIAAWLNAENQGTWQWAPVQNGGILALGFTGASRHQVHLADMNADGRHDYLIIDDDTGAVHCYLNLGQGQQSWQWNIIGEIAIGVNGVGAGVRIADFDGDGKADYFYIDDSGVVKVWLNAGPPSQLTKWVPVNGGAAVTFTTGAARDDIFFADIDGDGKADYCWIHPDTGALEVWYNLFDGQTVGWSHGGVLINNPGYTGRNMRLARMGWSGRYDYVAVEEESGALKAWLNECSNVIATARRPLAGRCGIAPMPTQTSSEPGPVFTARATELYPPGSTVSGSDGGPAITQVPAKCTSTYGNAGLVAYASGSGSACSGPSRVIWNGDYMTVKVEASRSAEVNSVTGTKLYASMTSALSSACTAATGGQTVSACPTATITGVTYYWPQGPSIRTDGVLEISIPYVRYSDNNVRTALIQAIASVANASSMDPSNQMQQRFEIASGSHGGSALITISTIPQLIEAIYSQQDLSTGGRVLLQNMEVEFSLATASGQGTFECSGLGLANSAIGLMTKTGALGEIGLAEGVSILGPVIGVTCLAFDAAKQNQGSGSGDQPVLLGDPVPARSSIQPIASFPKYPFTYTNKNGGTTAFQSTQTTDASGYYPTDPPNIVLAVGTTIKAEMGNTTSVNVGTLGSAELSSSLYSILTEACPSPTGTTVTGCHKPSPIQNVWYTQQPDHETPVFAMDGEVDISIPVVQYSTDKGWLTLTHGLAAMFGSCAANNSVDVDPGSVNQGIHAMHNVGDSNQLFFVQQDDSTNGVEQLEIMQVHVSFHKPGNPLTALVCDSFGALFGILGVVGTFVPGLEWLDVFSFNGPALTAECAGLGAAGE